MDPKVNAPADVLAGAMPVFFDPALVALSVLIAVSGAYTCFHLVTQLRNARASSWKALLSAAAVVIGGGIWSMHFVGMLALSIPVAVDYDPLGTLVSALVSIGMTGMALFVVCYWPASDLRIGLGGLLMGGGISAMHYVGMLAMRVNCLMVYDRWIVAASVLIGVAVSTLALWLAFRTRGRGEKLLAAVLMGLAIPAMHYTGIAAMTFLPAEAAIGVGSPALSQQNLAIVISVTTFLLFGVTFLVAIPNRLGPAPPAASGYPPASFPPPPFPPPGPPRLEARIPVVRNRATELVAADDIVCITAQSHYSTVFTQDAELFCSLSLAELHERLDHGRFLRVHRSHIVNIGRIKAFQRRREQGEVTIPTGNGERRVPVSRTNIGPLKAALGL